MKKHRYNLLPTTFSIFLFFFLLAFGLSGCFKKEESQSDEAPDAEVVALSAAQLKTAGIVLDTLRHTEIDELIHVNGVVDVPPQHLASVSVPMAGFVAENKVLPGQHVHKGETLALLKNSAYVDLQQELVRENSKLIFMEGEYKRQKEMLENDVTAKRDFQESESNYSAQKALVKGLEEKVKLLGLSPEKILKGDISATIQLVSPIDGYVKEGAAPIGKFVLPEAVLFEITDISHMHLELKVFERDAMKLRLGQKVRFSTPGAENMTAEGVVWLIGKNLDPATRTIGVHIHFDETKIPGLLPGMYVTATIQTSRQKVAALPEKAVFKEGNSYYVFCMKEKSAERSLFQQIRVEPGTTHNGTMEIKNAAVLKGKAIAIEGAYYIHAEMKKPEE